jgi:hypothetical protein
VGTHGRLGGEIDNLLFVGTWLANGNLGPKKFKKPIHEKQILKTIFQENV